MSHCPPCFGACARAVSYFLFLRLGYFSPPASVMKDSASWNIQTTEIWEVWGAGGRGRFVLWNPPVGKRSIRHRSSWLPTQRAKFQWVTNSRQLLMDALIDSLLQLIGSHGGIIYRRIEQFSHAQFIRLIFMSVWRSTWFVIAHWYFWFFFLCVV